MTPEEIVAEKLKQQRLVEEADNKLTEELFGIESAKLEDGVYDVDTCVALLNRMKFKTEEDYKILASGVSKVLQLEQKPMFTTEFLKELIRKVTVMLHYEDLVDIDSVLSVIKNTKVKKKLNKKKKKKGKFANVQRDELDDVQDTAGGAYGGYTEDDFM